MIHKEKMIRNRKTGNIYRTACGLENKERINKEIIFWNKVTCPECLKKSPYNSKYHHDYYLLKKDVEVKPKVIEPPKADMVKLRKWRRANQV